jgi:putative ABC transport system substrate-binding protein
VNRRDLIVAALATVCAPATAWAQASGRIRRIGWLDLSSSAENLGTFVQALSARGWIEGKTFRVDYRGGEGKPERLAAVAAELVRLPTDVIVAPAPQGAGGKKATNAVPIVMTGVDDPAGRGGRHARGRGEASPASPAPARGTGRETPVLLRDLSPARRASRSSWTPTVGSPRDLTPARSAARSLGFSVNAQQVQRHTEVEPAFAAIKKQGNQLLVVPMSNMLIPRWIADLALKHGLALASTAPAYVYEGGLMTYTDDWQALFDRAAIFVDRILKGARRRTSPWSCRRNSSSS